MSSWLEDIFQHLSNAPEPLCRDSLSLYSRKSSPTFQVNCSGWPNCANSSGVASPARSELACATSSRLPARQLTRFFGLPILGASRLALPSAALTLAADGSRSAAPVHGHRIVKLAQQFSDKFGVRLAIILKRSGWKQATASPQHLCMMERALTLRNRTCPARAAVPLGALPDHALLGAKAK